MSANPHISPRRSTCLIVGLLLISALPAGAATLTVGAAGSGCNHTNVQAAVNVAQSNPGADTIRITRSASWTAQQISINTDQDISLVGGYATCTSATPDGQATVLSGAGGDARPVLTVRGNGIVLLRGLTLRDGDQAGNDNGGGIFFEGGGILDIADTAIIENSARNGGGIYAIGTTLQAELVLGANVTVGFNTARDSGGGVFAKDIEMSLLGPGSSLLFNVAQGQGSPGRGGGLVVLASQLKSYAYISSNGIGGLGAIYANQAVDGGGIAVLGGVGADDEAEVRIFSRDSANPVRINGNIASGRGGAIYARPEAAVLPITQAESRAKLWYVDLDDNAAPVGAAVFLDYDNFGIDQEIGGELSFNLDRPPAAVACPDGRPCGSISGNSTGNNTGSIIEMNDGCIFGGARLLLQDNSAGRLVDMPTPEDFFAELSLRNSLITGNDVAQELIRAPDDSDNVIVHLYQTTIADNTIGAPHVLFVNDRLELINSLVSQPGKITLAPGADELQIVHVLTNDLSNLPNGPAALAPPRFIDPANGNYRLRAGSRGVDYAGTNSSETIDGDLHDIDVPIAGINAPNRIADVGAYERPALQPLVLNSDFDSDLNLWDGLSDSFWDGTQNASGPAGSGSVRIPLIISPERPADAPLAVGRSQCIHLPGPGTYTLNGFGRVSPSSNPPLTSNRARLIWELRASDSATGCGEGTVSQSGILNLASTSTWATATAPAQISLGTVAWSDNSSLTVKLDVIGSPASPPTAWFDGIRVDLITETIFKNGFDQD